MHYNQLYIVVLPTTAPAPTEECLGSRKPGGGSPWRLKLTIKGDFCHFYPAAMTYIGLGGRLFFGFKDSR